MTAGWLDPSSVGEKGDKGDKGDKGEKGDKGDKGDSGDNGAAGQDGVTPQLKVGEDNCWYVSYDNSQTWTSLNVKATGDKGDTGEKGETGLIPYIGDNGNWWLGDADTGVQASVKGDTGEAASFPEAEDVLNHYKEIVRGVRNVRAEMNVPNSRKATIYVVCENAKLSQGLMSLKDSVKLMAAANDFVIQTDKTGIADDAVSIVVPDATVYLPMEELIDFAQEIERLAKEETRLQKEIERANGMLNNEKFVSKAPEAKVQEEREKLEKYQQMLAQVQERLAGLKEKM